MSSIALAFLFPGEGHDNLLQYSSLGESHGQKSLADYSPWGCEELNRTEATYHQSFFYYGLSRTDFTLQIILPCLYFIVNQFCLFVCCSLKYFTRKVSIVFILFWNIINGSSLLFLLPHCSIKFQHRILPVKVSGKPGIFLLLMPGVFCLDA